MWYEELRNREVKTHIKVSQYEELKKILDAYDMTVSDFLREAIDREMERYNNG